MLWASGEERFWGVSMEKEDKEQFRGVRNKSGQFKKIMTEFPLKWALFTIDS